MSSMYTGIDKLSDDMFVVDSIGELSQSCLASFEVLDFCRTKS